jgi:hypothetical protein
MRPIDWHFGDAVSENGGDSKHLNVKCESVEPLYIEDSLGHIVTEQLKTALRVRYARHRPSIHKGGKNAPSYSPSQVTLNMSLWAI